MNIKKSFITLFLISVMLLSGCAGIVIPDADEVGGDFYVCENLIRGLYTALSNQNFALALSYCKSGGLTFKYVNDLWGLAQEYPTVIHATYQVYNVYDFSYLGGNLELYYNYSWTTTTTSYLYGRRMVFEKINGQWKMF